MKAVLASLALLILGVSAHPECDLYKFMQAAESTATFIMARGTMSAFTIQQYHSLVVEMLSKFAVVEDYAVFGFGVAYAAGAYTRGGSGQGQGQGQDSPGSGSSSSSDSDGGNDYFCPYAYFESGEGSSINRTDLSQTIGGDRIFSSEYYQFAYEAWSRGDVAAGTGTWHVATKNWMTWTRTYVVVFEIGGEFGGFVLGDVEIVDRNGYPLCGSWASGLTIAAGSECLINPEFMCPRCQHSCLEENGSCGDTKIP